MENKKWLEEYICGENSICREERQYALFLYNILKKYRSLDSCEGEKKVEITEIFKACRIPQEAKIENVFYEATFMRDFFEQNRKCFFNGKSDGILDENKDHSFNCKLVDYISSGKKKYSGKEYNLGRNAIECDELSEKEKYIIRCMMNAKPDLAVVYRVDNLKKKLLFLECKFESAEAPYEYGLSQTEIQWKIADFLCKTYLEKESIEVSEGMGEEKSCLVQFVRESTDEPNVISIQKLIELNNEIFI